MAEPTFREFAMSVMSGEQHAATAIASLQQLLALSPDAARAATEHFRAHLADPAFMQKAMGLRNAVTSGSDDDIGALLGECFGLEGDVRVAAVAALRARYRAN